MKITFPQFDELSLVSQKRMLYFSGMYQTLKKVALSIVPRKILFENEVFFRSIFAFHLHGKKHKCTICNQGIKNFIEIPDGDLLCPFCGSRSRTRRLFNYLNDNNLIKGSILHFSPSRSLYRFFSKNSNIKYSSSDYEDEFIAEYKYDITEIPVESDSFDLIICYHILEYIEDDEKAICELHRVLKINSTCVIQTPFKDGDIYEDFSKKTPQERLEAFGQEDHVRIYSVEGLKERLLKNGFSKVAIKNFPTDEYHGLMEQTILICKK